jgi:hypothetical protein
MRAGHSATDRFGMEDRPNQWRACALAAIMAMVFALLLALAESSVAHEGHTHPLSDREVDLAIGESAQPAADGLYRVRAAGRTLLTHGPDPAPPAERIATRVAGGVFGPNGEERPPACATDYYQHVLVGRIAGAPDRAAEVKASVQAAIRRMNWVLNADALASGGVTADYKVLCDEQGQIKVDSFASPSAQFEDIVRSAREAGFDDQNADYTIFFDALGPGGGCGIGSYRADDRLTSSNASNTGGGYGVAYQPCWFGTTPMHENAHNQGAVTYAAPQSTGSGGHCNQGHDVLCYTPDGGDRNQTPLNIACSDRPHFDCGAEDYFDTAPEPGEYLDSHWNLGSPLNRFIEFGRGAGVDDYEPEDTLPEIGTLRLGAVVQGVLTPDGEPALYELKVPRGKDRLTVSASTPGALRVYLRRGSAPDLTHWDCRSDTGSKPRCSVEEPRAGWWYVGVLGETSPSGFSLRARSR